MALSPGRRVQISQEHEPCAACARGGGCEGHRVSAPAEPQGPFSGRGRHGFGPETPGCPGPAGSAPPPSPGSSPAIASAATCRDSSAGETDVETTTVPSGNRRASAGNPSTILPWADAAAGKGVLMRGAGGEGTGSPVGAALTGGRTSRPAGAAAEPSVEPPVGVGAARRRPLRGRRCISRARTRGGAGGRRTAACRCRQHATPEARSGRHLVQHDGGASQDRRHADTRDDQPLGFHRLFPARTKAFTKTMVVIPLAPIATVFQRDVGCGRVGLPVLRASATSVRCVAGAGRPGTSRRTGS